MRLRGLLLGLVGWLGVAIAAPVPAAEPVPRAGALLQNVMRLEALPHSPEITALLQLLHTLAEIDLGMTSAAQRRLSAINGDLTITETAGQLWLPLALRYWQQGDSPQMQQALARLPQSLPAVMERERRLLQALFLHAQGNPAAALATLSELQHDAPLASAISLDRALLLLQGGEDTAAIELLQRLGQGGGGHESAERLRDRANLVLARSLTARGLFNEAQSVLGRIRLDGQESSAALLLLGWLRLEQGGGSAALIPWILLSLRNENDPAVIEGRLGLPLMLARRAPDQQALVQFAATTEFYRQRLVLLDTTLAELASAGDDAQWLSRGAVLLHGGNPRAAALWERHAALAVIRRQWVPPQAASYEEQSLRRALLVQLNEMEAALAADAQAVVWRELYGRLGRYLATSFERERLIGARPVAPRVDPGAEPVLMEEALAQLRRTYRGELLAALTVQRQRVLGYLEKTRYAQVQLYEAALLQGLERP